MPARATTRTEKTKVPKASAAPAQPSQGATPLIPCALCGAMVLPAVDPTTRKPLNRFPGPRGEHTCGKYCPGRKPPLPWPPVRP